jgi:hypothetical protein
MMSAPISFALALVCCSPRFKKKVCCSSSLCARISSISGYDSQSYVTIGSAVLLALSRASGQDCNTTVYTVSSASNTVANIR